MNNVEVVMEFVTASLTITLEKIQQKKLPNVELQPSTTTLKTYSGEQLKLLNRHK